MMFKHSRHKAGFFLFLITLLFSTWCLLHINPVQNWLVTNVSKTLSKELKTKVEIKHVDFSLFNKMLVQGVLIEDRKKDTLLYADALKVNITDWFFFEDNITLKYVGLAGAKINMNRTDSVWNYQFLVDYFVAPKKTARTAKGPIEIDLKVIDLDNVTINRVDKWAGQDLKGSVKKLHLTADDFDLTKKIIDINQLELETPVFALFVYKGNRPPLVSSPGRPAAIPDSGQLKLNADGWQFSIAKILIKNGTFINEKETARGPYTDRFDGQHLMFSNINGELSKVQLVNDTITTNIKLSTKEKSGFEIKQMVARVKLTPGMMEFSDLDIETGKSRIEIGRAHV